MSKEHVALPYASTSMEQPVVTQETPHFPPGQTAISLGLHGVCPRCGKGKLFNGWLKLATKCEVCGLDFGFADPVDGPAFFGQWAGCIPAIIFALCADRRSRDQN